MVFVEILNDDLCGFMFCLCSQEGSAIVGALAISSLVSYRSLGRPTGDVVMGTPCAQNVHLWLFPEPKSLGNRCMYRGLAKLSNEDGVCDVTSTFPC